MLLLSAAYLLLLNAWLGYDSYPALIRVFIYGLLLTALLTPVRIRRLASAEDAVEAGLGDGSEAIKLLDEAEKSPLMRSLPPLKWWVGSTAIALLFTGIGWIIADDRPVVTEPASWALQAQNKLLEALSSSSQAGRTVSGGSDVFLPNAAETALSGYGSADRMLGAPLKEDHTPLFTAVSPLPLYWRGESKSVYDGRGWSEAEDQRVTVVRSIGKSDDSKAITQTVHYITPSTGLPLLHAGVNAAVMKLKSDSKDDVHYLEDQEAGAIYPSSSEEAIVYYTIQSQPQPSEEDLNRTLNAGEQDQAGNNDQRELNVQTEKSFQIEKSVQTEINFPRYTQLPAELPKRVSVLASEIIGSAGDTQYEKVKAVEQYLKTHYTYTLTNTALPASGEDFVDQFLFQQNRDIVFIFRPLWSSCSVHKEFLPAG